MLIKSIFSALIFALFISSSLAQTTGDEHEKNEFFVGYSHQRGEFQDSRNGFEISAVRNFSRYFGIKGDFSAGFRDRTSTGSVIFGGVTSTFPVRTRTQVYNFLGGVQVKDNATKSRLKPFAHALIGVANDRFRNRVPDFCSTTPPDRLCNVVRSSEGSNVGFAGAFGGGLDIKINDKIDFRAIQVDYNPIYLNNGFRNNARFGVGIVFH
ncbi:MAG TPA: outer membrane beta-barrel protein [Pyrinomonadaceae bacterium]|jgi:hypothetical protein